MGRRGTAVAAVLAVMLVGCGTHADGTADGLGPGRSPAPTSGVTRSEITIDPISTTGESVQVYVDGPESPKITATIYRDGVLLVKRSSGVSRAGISSLWGVGTSAGHPLEGHTFVFVFQRADDSEYGRATVTVPMSSAAASPRRSGSESVTPTRLPTLPPAPATTFTPLPGGASALGTVYVSPIDPGSNQLHVMLRGRPGDLVGWAIYRDGVLVAPRSKSETLTGSGMFVGYESSVQPMGGHVFLFEFTADDGSLYASGSITYPLAPGATIAPEPTSFISRPTPTTPSRPTVEVTYVVPGSQTIDAVLRGVAAGQVVRPAVYRDGVRQPIDLIDLVAGPTGVYFGWEGNESRKIQGHEWRFEFSNKDGALLASGTIFVALLPGTTLQPDPALSTAPPVVLRTAIPQPVTAPPTPSAPVAPPLPSASPVAPPLPSGPPVAPPLPSGPPAASPTASPRPASGTTSASLSISVLTSTRANIAIRSVPNTKVNCLYLQDTRLIYAGTGNVPISPAGVGGCGIGDGTGAIPPAVYVIVVTLANGTELGRATLVYPLP